MMLSPGTRIGPYEVVAPIGAGGMGEVYRAHDAKLGRDVAVKILPDAFARDPERLGRFEREARTLATLNHPHIAQIYGFEESGGLHALVMELVEGPTLAEKLRQAGAGRVLSDPRQLPGPKGHGLQLDEATSIARQIADALEAAHEHGIIHRDLKPANIKVRDDGTVKVLDFGLAKAIDPVGSSSAVAMNSPTLTAHATQMGVILGTAAYMAPEQARGRAADRRADIWAFGVVLYEMLTGTRAFEGEEISDTLASVLKQDPDWSALPPDVPSSLRRLLRRCLEKDPRKRLASIADARLDLDERDDARIERPAAGMRVPSRTPWIAATIVAALVTGVATWLVSSARRSAAPTLVTRFSILPALATALLPDSTTVAISPDGRMAVFVTGTSTGAAADSSGLWLRPVGSLNAQRLAGTEGAVLPFWSPDGRQVAFFTNDHKLKKIAVEGGHVEEICDAPDGRGGTWNRDGIIVFAPANGGPLMRVPATGGTPRPVTTLDGGRGESGHRFPLFLPDGDHFLYAVVPARAGNFDIFVGSLSGSNRDLLLSAQSTPVFSEPGYLLFVRKGGLVVQRFDANRRTLSGEPVSLPDVPGAIGDQYMAGPAVSASAGGTLAYLSDLPAHTSLAWFDQAGLRTSSVAVPAGRYIGVSLAADGRHAVLIRWTSPTTNDLWIADLDRGGASRLTDASGAIQGAIWSPDGERVAFSNNPDGPRDIYIKSTGGANAEEPLYRSKALAKDPQSWSGDGQFLVYQELSPATNWDLRVLPLSGDRTPKPYVQTPFNDTAGVISPDGRWMAYLSDETGRNEVYVQSFPTPGRKYRVTTDGAGRAWWRNDGRQLLIVSLDRTQILVADVRAGSEFATDAARTVGRLPKGVTAIDATPDVKRLLALVDEGSDTSRSVTVVQNWTAALDRR
jgi:Tol biopolymer transport system component